MKDRKKIIIILSVIIVLAIIIQFFRSDFIIKLSNNKNIDMVGFNAEEFIQIDPSLLNSLPSDKYLVIYDENHQGSVLSKDNIIKILEQIKVPYDLYETSNISSFNSSYSLVILLLEDLDKLSIIDKLLNFVSEGGNIFIAYRPNISGNFSRHHDKFGIRDYGFLSDANGIRLLDNVLIQGVDFVSEENNVINSSMNLYLVDDCIEYAESIEGTPLLWRKKYGQGNIVYLNGTMTESKINRGFILGALSLCKDEYIYPILNSKVVYIDDFPAPFPDGIHDEIYAEFNRDIKKFFKDIWWPDMLRIAQKNDIRYTGVLIGNYDDDTENISGKNITLFKNDLIYYGRELLINKGELGIHGYNHQPFFTGELHNKELGYKPWKDKATMLKSIIALRSFLNEPFTDYQFRTYVPPSNILYAEGREALSQSGSGISIIASLYSNDGEPDAYEQEVKVADDGIIEMPRFTSGYSYTSINEWISMNSISLYGTFMHFVHPDDLLDPERSDNKSWSQLLEEYSNFHEMIHNKYPWLNSATSSEAANELIRFHFLQPKYEINNLSINIYCNNFYDHAYFILRTDKKLGKTEHCRLFNIDNGLYLVKAEKPISKIYYKR